MARILYATRSDIETNPSATYPPGLRAEIMESLRKASEQADKVARRPFHPTLADTKYYDYPNRRILGAWTLWVDDVDLLEVTALTVAGTVIPTANYTLEPVNDGPPYGAIRIDDTTTSSWSNDDTTYRAIQVDGTTGYTQETSAAGALNGALADTTGTTVVVTDPTKVEVGSLINIESEWLNVTERAYVDSGETVVGALTASVTDTTFTVSNDPGLVEGERISIDFEEMTVRRVSGTSVLVSRNNAGSVLAAHSAGAQLDRWTSFTVERGAAGSTAATHVDTTAVARWVPPGLAREFVIATAITDLQQHSSGYARTVGSGDSEREFRGVGLKDVRAEFELRLRRPRLSASI